MNITLLSLVRDLAITYPEGLKHKDFVRKILETGYVHDDNGISVAVHQTLKHLLADGFLVRSENEAGVREYLPAQGQLCFA